MSAPIFLTTQPDDKEKTILENLKTFIEKIIIDTKREQGEKNMTDMANFMDQCDVLGVLPGLIVNDNRRPSGRISDDERLRRNIDRTIKWLKHSRKWLAVQ